MQRLSLFSRRLRYGTAVSQTSERFQQRRHASAGSFDWTDALRCKELYTAEEVAIAENAEAYAQKSLLPRVLGIEHTKHAHLHTPVPFPDRA